MTHPIYHSKSSVKQFGGQIEDFMPIHHWLDATKEHYAGFRHRALRHHDAGIEEAVRVFGSQIKLSNDQFVDVRAICQAHIREDCGGKTPNICDWFDNVQAKSWMPGNTPMSISLDEFVRKWGGIASDYQPIVDWFEWAPLTYSDLTLKGYRYHAQGIFEAERTLGYTMTNSDGRIVPVRYVAELHVKVHCGGRIPSVGDWLDCINPATWMSRGYQTSKFEHAIDLDYLISTLHDQAIEFDALVLTSEHLPKGFVNAVRAVTRPYAKISEADYQRLFEVTEGYGDIVNIQNVKMTFGHADGGWALMPLMDEHQDVTFIKGL